MSEGRINTYLVILLVGRLSNERKWKTYDAVWTSGQGSRQSLSPCVGQGIGDTPGIEQLSEEAFPRQTGSLLA
jgi:hypothetical protein